MNSEEIRRRFLTFFENRGHKIIPSASLVPENDPTTLFTGSGMQPLVPYLLGMDHPAGKRIANSQKCFRAMDIEEVGDNRHTTFFEMLGNWSLGDYFKKEQLSWFFEFLTKEVGLPREKLWVTCFEGDERFGVPRDTESAEIWQSLGVTEDHIFFYGSKNWWTRSGAPETMPVGEPGGPDSEVFYEFTQIKHDPKFGKDCHPNCDCGRFLEIGNSVFMQYVKKDDGSFGLLPKQNVDFGGGLERIAAASRNEPDIFKVNHSYIIDIIERETNTKYTDYTYVYRIIADHIKAAVFLIADGVIPSNKDQGYFVRRLIRRSKVFANKLRPDFAIGTLALSVVDAYRNQYPELQTRHREIDLQITQEESKFSITLALGLKELEKGVDAFTLFTTYGFPLELTREITMEKGIKIDEDAFKKEMEKHQALSRAGSGQKFKGGLAGHSEIEVKYHTATHLLHQALREVLGETVFQKGSNITPERLRFDFSFTRKMTEEEKKKVENLVNKKIEESLPVSFEDLSLEEAEKSGAIGLFEEKYGDKVRVYKIGDFSLELCGGPHVENTGVLGQFKIIKEEAVSTGTRRIKAILE